MLEKKINANRIIMNLPFSSHKYFNNALKILAEEGIIHYYDIINDDEIINRIDYLKKISKKNNFNIKHFDIIKIKSYSPHEFYIGIDITAKKIADVA